jgi:hypothetical protein
MRKKLLSKICSLAFLAAALIPLAAWADEEVEISTAVPEPTSWVLFGIGALGIGWACKRRRRG